MSVTGRKWGTPLKIKIDKLLGDFRAAGPYRNFKMSKRFL